MPSRAERWVTARNERRAEPDGPVYRCVADRANERGPVFERWKGKQKKSRMHFSVSSVPPRCFFWRIMKIRTASSELSDIKSKISRQAFWLTDYPTYRAFPVTPVALMRCSSPNTVTAGMRWILTIFPFNIPYALKSCICSAPE